MRFTWDEDKRRANLAKHGIDFPRAALVFDGRPRVNWVSPRAGELRWKTVAQVDGRAVVVVWTTREGICRIISARRARHDEEAALRDL